MKVIYQAEKIETIKQVIPNSGRVILELTYEEAGKVRALFGELINEEGGEIYEELGKYNLPKYDCQDCDGQQLPTIYFIRHSD